jgi:hypothetical protein
MTANQKDLEQHNQEICAASRAHLWGFSVAANAIGRRCPPFGQPRDYIVQQPRPAKIEPVQMCRLRSLGSGKTTVPAKQPSSPGNSRARGKWSCRTIDNPWNQFSR